MSDTEHRTPGAPLADHHLFTHRSSSRKPRGPFSTGQRPRVPVVHCTVWPSVGPKTRVPTNVCGLRPLGKDCRVPQAIGLPWGHSPGSPRSRGGASLAQTPRGGEKHPSPGPVNSHSPTQKTPQSEQRPLESSERSPPAATTARGGGRLPCAGGRAWGLGMQGPGTIAGLTGKPGGHSAALPVAPELDTTSTLKGGLRETKFCAGEDAEGQGVRGAVSLRAEQATWGVWAVRGLWEARAPVGRNGHMPSARDHVATWQLPSRVGTGGGWKDSG